MSGGPAKGGEKVVAGERRGSRAGVWVWGPDVRRSHHPTRHPRDPSPLTQNHRRSASRDPHAASSPRVREDAEAQSGEGPSAVT